MDLRMRCRSFRFAESFAGQCFWVSVNGRDIMKDLTIRFGVEEASGLAVANFFQGSERLGYCGPDPSNG